MADGAHWEVVLRGFGLAHGPGVTRSISIDTLAKRFVMDVVAAGHELTLAELLVGKSENLKATAKAMPLPCSELYHVFQPGWPGCQCGKLKVSKKK